MPSVPFIETEEAYKTAFGWVELTQKSLETPSTIDLFNKIPLGHLCSSGTTVVLYSAEWADQCSQVLAVMEQLAKDNSYQSMKFLNVAIEEIPTVAQQLEVNFGVLCCLDKMSYNLQ